MLVPEWFKDHQNFGCRSSFDHAAHDQRTQVLLDRDDITDAKKLALLGALNGRGDFGKAVRARQPVCPFVQSETDDSKVIHIRPWDQCTDEQRLDPENGILLGAEYAQYFISGYISFAENGHYYFSEALDEDVWMGCRGGEVEFALPSISEAQQSYLMYHRAFVFEHWLIHDGVMIMKSLEAMAKSEPGWILAPSGEGYIFKEVRENIAQRMLNSLDGQSNGTGR